MSNPPAFNWRVRSADPIQIGDYTLTFQSRILSVRLPYWGWVIHWPVAVQVEQSGQTEQIPIPNLQHSVRILFILSTLVWMLFIGLLFTQRRSDS